MEAEEARSLDTYYKVGSSWSAHDHSAQGRFTGFLRSQRVKSKSKNLRLVFFLAREKKNQKTVNAQNSWEISTILFSCYVRQSNVKCQVLLLKDL